MKVFCVRVRMKNTKKVCNVFVHVYRKKPKKYAMFVFCVRVSTIVMQCYNIYLKIILLMISAGTLLHIVKFNPSHSILINL
jgi:hypothetical protein